MRTAIRLAPFLLVFCAGACGRKDVLPFAAVSGKVTAGGEPIAGVIVTFEPLAAPGRNATERPASAGVTDASGMYTLKGGGGQADGALVGKHRVRLARTEPELKDETDPTYDVRAEMKKLKGFKRLPKRYSANSELTFEVPASGTDKANFDVQWE